MIFGNRIESWIQLFFYLIGLGSLVGIWVSLGMNVQKIRERMRINRQIKLAHYNNKWLRNPLMKKYHFLLSSALKKYEVEHFSKIVTMQIMVFILFMIVLYFVIFDIVFVLLIALIFCFFIPLGFLYFMHKQKQNSLRNGIVEDSVVLLQEYRKNHYHMIYALKELASKTHGSSQVAYGKLFARMHDDNDKKILAAENFSFQLGHFRGKNLASIVLRACKDGTQVSSLLEDLVADITEFNKRTRDAEAEARETALIGFAPLPLLVVLHLVNDNWLIPGGNAYHYEFQTAQGLKSFLIAVVFGIVGIGLALIVRKPKK